ncbi:MAG: PAS domain S-box protein, partial [Patescibacteria group bacterium]|nr:PAS domain S-box protein [Patescibacteria group bacterium]
MRKKIKEEKLKNNEDDSLWNAPLPIYEIDFRGPKFIRVNDAFCRYTGHTRKQLLKKNPLSFLDNDSKTEFKERIRKKLAGKKVNTIIRCKSKTKDGRRHFAELNIAFIYNQNKKIKSAIIIIHDITDYKRTEETINLQKEELQTIMDSVPASIFYKDKNNNFLQVNKSFAKSMGVSKQELEGKSLFDLYPKEQAKAFLEDDLEVIKTGKPKLGIIEQAEGKKGIVWFQTDKIPYRDEK